MAIDKTCRMNGLEVNLILLLLIHLIVQIKVGIASTAPRVTLDVRGGIAATDLNITGVATLASVDISSWKNIRCDSDRRYLFKCNWHYDVSKRCH